MALTDSQLVDVLRGKPVPEPPTPADLLVLEELKRQKPRWALSGDDQLRRVIWTLRNPGTDTGFMKL